MKPLLIVGFSFLLMSHACHKEAISEECGTPPVETSLTGTWKWVRTDGGFANNIHETPASTGKIIELTIQSNGMYAFTTNGVVTSAGTYHLQTRNCIHSSTQKTFINFSGDTDLTIEKTTTVTELWLSDDAYDGISIEYKK
jgi:hypothetical protein